MKEIIKKFSLRKAFLFLLPLLMLLFLPACASTRRIKVDEELALRRVEEKILLIEPLSVDPEQEKICESLGNYFYLEIPKRVNGALVYSKNIESLDESATWDNLIKNGVLNTKEASAIALTVGCKSVLSCQIMKVKRYPPFRMVVLLQWIDSESGKEIARLYNDVDLENAETLNRYNNYAGHNPVKRVYEKITYSEDLGQTAYLMPDKFRLFVAAYSAEIIFTDFKKVPWWYFWRMAF